MENSRKREWKASPQIEGPASSPGRLSSIATDVDNDASPSPSSTRRWGLPEFSSWHSPLKEGDPLLRLCIDLLFVSVHSSLNICVLIAATPFPRLQRSSIPPSSNIHRVPDVTRTRLTSTSCKSREVTVKLEAQNGKQWGHKHRNRHREDQHRYRHSDQTSNRRAKQTQGSNG